jgi:hypothetical protein
MPWAFFNICAVVALVAADDVVALAVATGEVANGVPNPGAGGIIF